MSCVFNKMQQLQFENIASIYDWYTVKQSKERLILHFRKCLESIGLTKLRNEPKNSFKFSKSQTNVLGNKSNWLYEYLILKNVVMKRANLLHIMSYIFNNVSYICFLQWFSLYHRQNCKLFYKNLLPKKFQNPFYQSYLNREFCNL